MELSMLLTVGLACSTLAVPWGKAEVLPEGPAPRVAQAPSRPTATPEVRFAARMVTAASRPVSPRFDHPVSVSVPAASHRDSVPMGLRLLGAAVLARVHH